MFLTTLTRLAVKARHIKSNFGDLLCCWHKNWACCGFSRFMDSGFAFEANNREFQLHLHV